MDRLRVVKIEGGKVSSPAPGPNSSRRGDRQKDWRDPDSVRKSATGGQLPTRRRDSKNKPRAEHSNDVREITHDSTDRGYAMTPTRANPVAQTRTWPGTCQTAGFTEPLIAISAAHPN